MGSKGADVYSEAKVEDEGENSSIKITIDTEQPDTGLEVENTLIGDEKRITATLDNDGVEQTKKIKIDLETDSDSDHQEAEGHIHIDSKKAWTYDINEILNVYELFIEINHKYINKIYILI